MNYLTSLNVSFLNVRYLSVYLSNVSSVYHLSLSVCLSHICVSLLPIYHYVYQSSVSLVSLYLSVIYLSIINLSVFYLLSTSIHTSQVVVRIKQVALCKVIQTVPGP